MDLSFVSNSYRFGVDLQNILKITLKIYERDIKRSIALMPKKVVNSLLFPYFKYKSVFH